MTRKYWKSIVCLIMIFIFIVVSGVTVCASSYEERWEAAWQAKEAAWKEYEAGTLGIQDYIKINSALGDVEKTPTWTEAWQLYVKLDKEYDKYGIKGQIDVMKVVEAKSALTGAAKRATPTEAEETVYAAQKEYDTACVNYDTIHGKWNAAEYGTAEYKELLKELNLASDLKFHEWQRLDTINYYMGDKVPPSKLEQAQKAYDEAKSAYNSASLKNSTAYNAYNAYKSSPEQAKYEARVEARKALTEAQTNLAIAQINLSKIKQAVANGKDAKSVSTIDKSTSTARELAAAFQDQETSELAIDTIIKAGELSKKRLAKLVVEGVSELAAKELEEEVAEAALKKTAVKQVAKTAGMKLLARTSGPLSAFMLGYDIGNIINTIPAVHEKQQEWGEGITNIIDEFSNDPIAEYYENQITIYNNDVTKYKKMADSAVITDVKNSYLTVVKQTQAMGRLYVIFTTENDTNRNEKIKAQEEWLSLTQERTDLIRELNGYEAIYKEQKKAEEKSAEKKSLNESVVATTVLVSKELIDKKAGILTPLYSYTIGKYIDTAADKVEAANYEPIATHVNRNVTKLKNDITKYTKNANTVKDEDIKNAYLAVVEQTKTMIKLYDIYTTKNNTSKIEKQTAKREYTDLLKQRTKLISAINKYLKG